MASFNGRRAPNVSQYIANLNTIPSASDMAASQDFAAFDDEQLALLTNADFFDFDMGQNMPQMPNNVNFAAPTQAQVSPHEASKNVGFVNQPNFNYEYTFQAQPPQPRSRPNSLPTSPQNGLPFASQQQQSQPTVPSALHFATYPSLNSGPNLGEQRQSAGSLPPTNDLEFESRDAAEEDKRRRNTAASARFRVKKKQREQALEKSAKEMSDKVQKLEARIGQLEMENLWLKGLITERSIGADGKKGSDSSSAAAVAAAAAAEDDETLAVGAKKGAANAAAVVDKSDIHAVEVEESSPAEKKRGVGTEGGAVEA